MPAEDIHTRLIVKSPLGLSVEERRVRRLSFGRQRGNMCARLGAAIHQKDKFSRVAMVRDNQSRQLLAWALIVSPSSGYRSPKISVYTRASHGGAGAGTRSGEGAAPRGSLRRRENRGRVPPQGTARRQKWDMASAEFWGSFGSQIRARCPWHRADPRSCPCYLSKYDGALVFTIDATT